MTGTFFSYQDIENFHQRKTLYYNDFDIISGPEIPLDVKRKFTHNSILDHLETSLGSYDWSQSFIRPQVISYRNQQEYGVTVLESLHYFLRQRGGNIENVTLISTDHLGINDWWKNYMDAAGEKTYRIHEWLDLRCWDYDQYYTRLDCVRKSAQQLTADRPKFNYVFSWYGGSYIRSKQIEKPFFTIVMKDIDHLGVVDVIAKDVDPVALINHAEFLSYYSQDYVDLFKSLCSRFIDQNNNIIVGSAAKLLKQNINETLDYQGTQYMIDRQCFATVVRETTDTAPFASLTEKTIRAFFHGMAVVPMGYRAVHYLEQLGFWFPHDIFDYSYQHEKDPLVRYRTMIDEIKKLSDTYTLAQLRDYYCHNASQFAANVKTVVDYHDDKQCKIWA